MWPGLGELRMLGGGIAFLLSAKFGSQIRNKVQQRLRMACVLRRDSGGRGAPCRHCVRHEACGNNVRQLRGPPWPRLRGRGGLRWLGGSGPAGKLHVFWARVISLTRADVKFSRTILERDRKAALYSMRVGWRHFTVTRLESISLSK